MTHRFGLIGCGFWSQYHLSAWGEIDGVQCVAVCDHDLSKATRLAKKIGKVKVYESAQAMIESEQLDFVDIVSDVNSHVPLIKLAIKHQCPAICQKPLAPSLAEATEIVSEAKDHGQLLLVHENWRWQRPIRVLKSIMDSGQLGQIVRARIDYANSFPVFDNQPFLKELDQFILTDIGTHILDVSRFLFGEASQLYCQTRRIRQDICGEDVATVMLVQRHGVTVTCNMSYASRWQDDKFPQTMIAIEGTEAGVSLDQDFVIRTYAGAKRESNQVQIPHYDWADPDYDLIHSSIVDCHRNLLSGLQGSNDVETTGEDNLKTLALVFGAYRSANENAVIQLSP